MLGLTVVVDAVNESDAARQVWRDVAARAEVQLRFVVLLAPSTAEHQRRLHARRRGLDHVRERSWSQVVARAEAYEPWSDERIELPGAEPVEQLLRRLRSALGNAR